MNELCSWWIVYAPVSRYCVNVALDGGRWGWQNRPLCAILISSWYADTVLLSHSSVGRDCVVKHFFLFLYVVMYGAWNWWRKWSSEASFNVITQQKFWNGILFPSITIVRCLPWPADSGCVGQESPYSEPEWSLTFVQKPSSGNYAETIPVQSKPWHWIFVYSVIKFCSWVGGTPVLQPLVFTFGFCPKE